VPTSSFVILRFLGVLMIVAPCRCRLRHALPSPRRYFCTLTASPSMKRAEAGMVANPSHFTHISRFSLMEIVLSLMMRAVLGQLRVV
jgi:hypothetical protein